MAQAWGLSGVMGNTCLQPLRSTVQTPELMWESW